MKNNKKGFTLVELVIVVAVMAVLVAVAIPTVGSVRTSAQNAVNDTNCRTIESMIKLGLANDSKNTDTKATLSADKIDEYLTNAQLGISGTFYYSEAAGNCSVSEGGDYTITLDVEAEDEDGICVVEEN